MTRCARMHAGSERNPRFRGQAKATLDGAPLCRHHLNREIKEKALRTLARAAPRCPEEGHKTQLPRYRPDRSPTLFCWGTKISGPCRWRYEITHEAMARAEKEIRESRVLTLQEPEKRPE